MHGNTPRACSPISQSAIAKKVPVEGVSRRRPIFLVGTTGDDLERVIRQRSLQRHRLIPWRSHPSWVAGWFTGWRAFLLTLMQRTLARRLRTFADLNLGVVNMRQHLAEIAHVDVGPASRQ
jgi:hypothetical protein